MDRAMVECPYTTLAGLVDVVDRSSTIRSRLHRILTSTVREGYVEMSGVRQGYIRAELPAWLARSSPKPGKIG